MMSRPRIYGRINRERNLQDEKWGTEFKGRPDQQWLAILMEEVGEAAQEVLKATESAEPKVLNVGRLAVDIRLEEEIVQIAAVCLSWLEFRTPFVDQIKSDVV